MTIVATGLPSTKCVRAIRLPSSEFGMEAPPSLSGRILFFAISRIHRHLTIHLSAYSVKKAHIEQFYRRLRDANPAPTTELHYATPFQLLIAVILSAQATDVGVNKATQRLFQVAPTPETMLALGEEGLTEYIKTIGLFRTKAKNVIATCRMLVELHGGEVPEDREALEACPVSVARPPTSC